MFADKVEIQVEAGRGGDGKLSFRHEKFRAKGGPDGGDGGRGGDVIFAVNHNLSTLSKYRTQRTVRAENADGGGKNRRHGKSGANVTLAVPPGTLVWEAGQLVADLTAADQSTVIARGGRGGFGNAHFKASTRQAPRTAELGEPGESRRLTLELKLVADVGLIGLPNAGKSTLLASISNAKPVIADYAFTTLAPNLGVVDIDQITFLAADIPGLIEGASQGKGLGDDFLRHIERTAVLIHLVDVTVDDPVAAYRTVLQELLNYRGDLSAKPQLMALSKIDAVPAADLKTVSQKLKKVLGGQTLFEISASAHRGLEPLLRATAALVEQSRVDRAAEEAWPVIDELTQPELWKLEAVGEGRWRVRGDRIEGFARRTDMTSPDAVARLRDITEKMGIAKQLRRREAAVGDKLEIADRELDWLG